jgi:hypothetical protein
MRGTPVLSRVLAMGLMLRLAMRMALLRDGRWPVKGRKVLLACAVLLLLAASVLAQTGGGYDLTWSTVDGGGATFSTGGGYSLGGTAGQPDAGLLTGGGYTLGGGFWGGGTQLVALGDVTYLPLILR